jgi:hypothetical protein
MAKPWALVISLHRQHFFDEMFAALLAEISEKATLDRIDRKESALCLLSQQPPPSAVVLTDDALTEKTIAAVWDAVLQYVRQGSVSVIMGTFTSFVKPSMVKPFFAKAGLPWEFGSYHRTTVSLIHSSVGSDLASKLPAEYSQKAVSLKNVTPEQA